MLDFRIRESYVYSSSEEVGGEVNWKKTNDGITVTYNFFPHIFLFHHHTPYTIIQVFSPFATCMETAFSRFVHIRRYIFILLLLLHRPDTPPFRPNNWIRPGQCRWWEDLLRSVILWHYLHMYMQKRIPNPFVLWLQISDTPRQSWGACR